VASRPYVDSFLLASDVGSFRRQESTFILFNLALLAGLLLLQAIFASYWGNPSKALVIALSVGFLLKTTELIWIQTLLKPLTWRTEFLLRWGSAGLNTVLALVLTILTDREDSPYFVLMIIPILEVAFRSRLFVTLGVAGIGSFLNFFFVWFYFRLHPPLEIGEYFEAGISSLTFLLVGVVVWVLVNNLRQNEKRLGDNLRELAQTRERLLEEERLAAVGRLSSAIAHEIRNPVAMISSSLATASRNRLPTSEREEMYAIAAKESDRLVTLTSDFLAYARPRPPVVASHAIADTLDYVASVCRAHAQQKQVGITVKPAGDLRVAVDSGQIQQALLNLVMNAIEASPSSGMVALRAEQNGSRSIHLDVENGGGPIPETVLSQIFEPFFTTKPHGSGLGLAIARSIARAHGGDLTISANEPTRICFSMTLPAISASERG